MPCYEDGSRLPVLLDALRVQTVSELEILVIDDGSRTDLVHDVPVDPRIVVDRLPVTRGDSAVTVHALTRARARWVLFLDPDDEVEPNHVETLLTAGVRHRADLVLAPDLPEGRAGGRRMVRGALGPRVMGSQEAFLRGIRGELMLRRDVLLRDPDPADVPPDAEGRVVLSLRHLEHCRAVAVLGRAPERPAERRPPAVQALRPRVWEVTRLPAQLDPTVAALFPEGRARAVRREVRAHVVTHLLRTAAQERRDTVLQREVYAWCRDRITMRGIGRLLLHGQWAPAVSWALALGGNSVHARAVRLLDASRWRVGGPVAAPG